MRKALFTSAITAHLLVTASACTATEFEASGEKITFHTDGSLRTCLLSAPANFATASNDGSAVIISARGYLRREDLENCSSDVPVRVNEIPKGVGFLTDINLRKGIYVSLDFVSVQPFLYLATVARIGTTKNLVSISGSYLPSKRISKLAKHAFLSDGIAGSSIISPSGDYVAPSGSIDCDPQAFPGVWDIKKNKRVIETPEVCSELFGNSKGRD
ncbi:MULTISPECIES: hypothetical protein [Cupriavidus]|uniref:Uncharacterized protein n=1 Tax=Cupriavidus campinensis TaxID=151783 RepID=A0ABY3EP73_9BURK|nr:hypothetical protein [Cupriavidus campinensis]TSP12763.1 hypothetical protein FGG12_11190 [Cupriavidus campinensis]